MNPRKTGNAFAATLAISYGACALGYAMAPEWRIGFLNALFHGLGFRKLASPEPFTLPMFIYLLLVFVVWGFLVGALYAWMHGVLNRGGGKD